ncbi:MAG: hypothetical protein M3020_17485 [Myxococcota bacterium]|jgi:hypothetical protein|nr:hypothetical protein [Myxococcota bacterium]
MIRSFRTPKAWPAIAAICAVSACAGRVPAPAAIDALVVTKDEPPPEALQIANIEAQDGSGCGITGTGGSYEGALRKLRLKAEAVGADFVQLTEVKEPYHDHQCAHREFALKGVAYRVGSAPAPVSSASTAPVANAVAPPASEEGGPAFRIGKAGFQLRSANAPVPASLTLAARLTGPRFAIWIDEPESAPGTSGYAVRYERDTKKLEVWSYPAAAPISVAAEAVELDQRVHVWRVTRSPEQIEVFLDGKRLLVTLVKAAASESSFRLEPDQVEVRRISP